MFLLRFIGWLGLLLGIYSIGDSIKRDYYERAKLQTENLWLYKHCLENAQLKAHTDACDRVNLLFIESPLEGAILHPTIRFLKQIWENLEELHSIATEYVNENRFMFVGIWLIMFLILPRLCIFAFNHNTHLKSFLDLKQERREARLRAAAMISAIEQPLPLRQRRQCIV
jgi:hypothetical protein